MLPYRLFMLLVLLVGLGLGLFVPRPWSDVPEAQAARKNNGSWLCLGKGVMLYNMSSKPIGPDVTVPLFYRLLFANQHFREAF